MENPWKTLISLLENDLQWQNTSFATQTQRCFNPTVLESHDDTVDCTSESPVDGKHPITLWLCQIAIENGPFILDLPIQDGDFPVRKLLVYQRVKPSKQQSYLPMKHGDFP